MKKLSILKAIKGKPSIALQHMVNGLIKQSKRKNFKIAMSTYGNSDNKICYGCAATCAVQSVTKTNFTPYFIDDTKGRAEITKTDYNELDTFEGAINMARQGCLNDLFEFCRISRDGAWSFQANFDLWDDNWKEELPKVRKLISQLKKAGY